MPYKVKATDGKFKVVNPETGKVHAKKTTKTKAEKQARLLRAVEHGFKPATSYKEFVKQQFKKRPAGVSASAYMKEIGAKWRKIKGTKGKGDTLLLQPGLGQTSADYTRGGGDTLLLQPGLGQTSADYVSGGAMMYGGANVVRDLEWYIQKLERIKRRARDAWDDNKEEILRDLRAAHSMIVDDGVQFDDDLIQGMEASAQEVLNEFPTGREESKGYGIDETNETMETKGKIGNLVPPPSNDKTNIQIYNLLSNPSRTTRKIREWVKQELDEEARRREGRSTGYGPRLSLWQYLTQNM